MSKTLEIKIPRATSYTGIFPELGDVVAICLLYSLDESEYAYRFNLAWSVDKYNLSGLTDLGTGQTQTLPFSYAGTPAHSISITETTNTFYTITITFDDSLYLAYCNGVTVSFPASGGSVSTSVDFTPVITMLNSLTDKANSISYNVQIVKDTVSSVNSNLGITKTNVDTLIFRVPANLASTVDTVSTNVNTVSTKVDAVATSVNSLDFSGVDFSPLANLANLPTDLTPIDATNLNGHFSKFVPGDTVFYGLYGLWEVLKVSLTLTSEDTYTPLYQLRQNTAPVGSTPTYRYNTVPQSVLSLYVAPATVIATTTTNTI